MKSNLIFKILLILITISLFVSCQETWKKLNYELFYDKEIKELALAVDDEDVEKINFLVRVEKYNVNYIEPKYGQTLLKLAILTKKRKSIKKMLELGADPNIQDKLQNKSAFHFACEMYTLGATDLELIDLMLEHGADIDEPCEFNNSSGNCFDTPLQLSIDAAVYSKKDELFYHLIEKGANIDKCSKDSLSYVLRTAATFDRFDLVKYLVIEKKCHIPTVGNVYYEDGKPHNETVVQFFERINLHNDKYENDLKEVIKYLKSKGFK